MTKEVLKDYVHARELIKETELRLKRLKEEKKAIRQDSVRGSNPVFPYQEKSFHIEGAAYYVYHDPGLIEETEKILEERRKKAEETKRKVEWWLNEQPLRIQRIVSMKYFEGLTWQQVSWNGTTLTVDGKITAGSGSKIGAFTIGNALYTKKNSITGGDGNVYLGTDGLGFGNSYLSSFGGAAFVNMTQDPQDASKFVSNATQIEGCHISTYASGNDAATIDIWGGTGAIDMDGDLNADGTVTGKTALKTSGSVTASGGMKAGGEIVSTSANAFRAVFGNYGFIVRNDGNCTYLMTTASGYPYGTWNKYITIANADCAVTMPSGLAVNGSITASANITASGQVWHAALDNGNSRPLIATGDANYRVSRIWTTSTTQMRVSCQAGVSTFATQYVAMTSSDVRLKENIRETEVTSAMNAVEKMKLRSFDWKDGKKNRHQRIGFIADELELIDERLVMGGGYDEDGHLNIKSIDTFYLVGYLTKAIQELKKEITIMQKRMEECA